MSSKWIDKLFDEVDQCSDFKALASIMQHIGIDLREIQNLIKQKIQQLDSAAAKRAAFNALSMQSILPQDTIQHVLSFQHYGKLRRVSKAFKKGYERNQNIAKRSRQKIVEDHAHYFAPNFTYNESTNQTFVVRPDGDPLAKSVQSFGTVIPWNGNLKDLVANHSTSGDRILVQDGDYKVEQCLCQNKVLQIIGIGENVNVTFNAWEGVSIEKGSKVLMKNIKFSFKSFAPCDINIQKKSKLWMENCTVLSKARNIKTIGVALRDHGKGFYAKSCSFIGHRTGVVLLGEGDDEEDVNILGCSFKRCKEDIVTKIPLRCIGNLFIGSRVSNVRFMLSDTEKLKVRNESMFIGNVYEKTKAEFDWLY